MTSAEEVPDEILTRAREISDEADEFNSMTWHGPFQDGIRDVVAYVWRKAHDAGYQQGCEDSA
jgi:hypothetical protein